MNNIGARQSLGPEIGVATEDGKSYFSITSLLKQIRVPYIDIIAGNQADSRGFSAPQNPENFSKNLRLIITTRHERLLFSGSKVMCIEDLGDDAGVAKERIFSAIYPQKEGDYFVVGIDPGERTGLAAFMNNREIESSVFVSIEEALNRVLKLVDNAPNIRKIVKIGTGMPHLAEEIARRLDSQCEKKLVIQFVDERGTSTLTSSTRDGEETRDQRAAKLIAFRDGQDYMRAR